MSTPSRLLAFAARWFDPTTVHLTFEPLIADWQREWIDAQPAQRVTIHVKGFAAFCMAAVVSTPSMARVRAPRHLTDDIARRIALVMAIGTTVLMLPMLLNFAPTPLRFVMILAALPKAMALIFPFAMTAAVDAIRNIAALEAHIARATVFKLAVLAVVVMSFSQGWIMPAANQAFRRATSHSQPVPMPGARELNTIDLVMTRAEIAREPAMYPFGLVLQQEINKRFALALLPVLLLWLRWRELNLRGPVRARTSVGTLISIFMFFVAWYLSRPSELAWDLPTGAGVWVALCLLALSDTLRVRLVHQFEASACVAS